MKLNLTITLSLWLFSLSFNSLTQTQILSLYISISLCLDCSPYNALNRNWRKKQFQIHQKPTMATTNGDQDSVIVPLLSVQRTTPNSTSQVAIVGSKVCPIESLDYEYVSSNFFYLLWKKKQWQKLWKLFCVCLCVKRIFENELFKQDWRGCGKVHVF